MNESQRCCTKVGRWTAHQRIASFPRTLFRDREAGLATLIVHLKAGGGVKARHSL
jgi:hypothetical protein